MEENTTQEVFSFFFVLQTSGRKRSMEEQVWGAQFLWQQASWETAVNQSMTEISRG